MKDSAILQLLEGHNPRQQSFRAWLLRLLILLIGATATFLLTFRIILPWAYHLALYLGILATYILLAYLVIPFLWRLYVYIRLPKGLPARTTTGNGLPDDPINIALIGSKRKVLKVMSLMGWQLIDSVNPISIFKVTRSVLFKRPYPRAPMDTRYLWGRKVDLGFQKSAYVSAARRHHIRLWQAQQLIDGAVVWVGNVHFDRKIGLSWLTGQFTHKINPDVDAERDLFIAELSKLGLLKAARTIPIPSTEDKGKNAGGTRYFTDGKIKIAIL